MGNAIQYRLKFSFDPKVSSPVGNREHWHCCHNSPAPLRRSSLFSCLPQLQSPCHIIQAASLWVLLSRPFSMCWLIFSPSGKMLTQTGIVCAFVMYVHINFFLQNFWVLSIKLETLTLHSQIFQHTSSKKNYFFIYNHKGIIIMLKKLGSSIII